jgi:GNAT superfamily N-acetyltransferase
MGLSAVAGTDLATIVTALEMTVRPLPQAIPDAPLRLVRWQSVEAEKYRMLFRRVGAPWLWFSRLMMTDEALNAITHNPAVVLSVVVDPSGIEVGILELDFRQDEQCELAFFGLVPELAGKGYGRWLMGRALAQAWRPGVKRVWVHTCTLDHPTALGFYRRSGFTPYERSVETFPDPRIIGILPRGAAPQIPLLAAAPDTAR